MEDKFQATLREHGRSVTKSRLLLFRYLETHSLVTPRQFIEDNRGVADQASLYRTLLMFKNLGIIEERIMGGKRTLELSDAYDSHHHHLTCMECGKSVAITLPEMEGQLAALGKRRGFQIERHTIELEGVCAECLAKSDNHQNNAKALTEAVK